MIIIQNQTPPHVWSFEYACSMSCMLSVVDIGVVLRELDSNTRSIRVCFLAVEMVLQYHLTMKFE